jgi:hypothetical protein
MDWFNRGECFEQEAQSNKEEFPDRNAGQQSQIALESLRARDIG